jgi:hypothetical protein
MRYRKATGLENQIKFFCLAMAKEKNRAAKIKTLITKSNNDMKKLIKLIQN